PISAWRRTPNRPTSNRMPVAHMPPGSGTSTCAGTIRRRTASTCCRCPALVLDLGHVALMLLVAAIGAWISRGRGLHDQAPSSAPRDRRPAGVQLRDESVALTRLRAARGRWGRPGLRRRYAVEFTVTGERRYAGFVEMQGRHLCRVELAPHPFPGGKDDE